MIVVSQNMEMRRHFLPVYLPMVVLYCARSLGRLNTNKDRKVRVIESESRQEARINLVGVHDCHCVRLRLSSQPLHYNSYLGSINN